MIVLARMRGETLKEIGTKLGITRERVRQIEEWSIKRMRGLAELMGHDVSDAGCGSISGTRRAG